MSRLTLVLANLVFVAASCMWSAPDLARPSLVLAELRANQDDYNDDCDRWAEPSDAGNVPTRHVDDVYLMTDDMLEACDDLMSSSRIGRDDRDRIAGMRARIRDSVDGHRTRFDDLQDGEAMHGECSDHHQQMLDLFNETEDDLRTGGMMGSNGMM